MAQMNWFKNLFKKEPKQTKHSQPTREEVEIARQGESAEYITICQKLLLGKITGRPIGFSNQDPNMSALDKMILPNVMAGSIMGMFGGGVVCDESCPGYTPIPVEAFPLAPGANDVVRCQRFVPKNLLEKFGGWEGFRKFALNLQS